MREDAIWPNNQTRHGQLSRQNTANCRVKIRPTVVSKYGQLAHLLQKTGTGRISRLKLRTMTLWESEDSTGMVSLGEL